MKRIVAGLLWLVAGAYLGGYIAFLADVPKVISPILGLLAALFVWIDPLDLIWTPRRTAPVSSASASTLVENTN